MAVSAFKSSSKKGSLSNCSSYSRNLPKKTASRRSKSVSASSRIYTDITSDFIHTWNNPLFCSSESSPGSEIQRDNAFQIAEIDRISSEVGSNLWNDNFNPTRGKSVARNVHSTSTMSTARKEVAGSLSRVSTGRKSRSMSRNPESRLHCMINECSGRSGNRSNKSNRSQENIGKSKVVTGETLHNLNTTNSLCPSVQDFSFSDDSTTPNLEDMVSFSYLSDTEEKRITDDFEQLIHDDSLSGEDDGCGVHEVISFEASKRYNSTPTISVVTSTHTNPELINPEETDIRREYTEKYEESQERVRKLKADLALEEQRGQQLCRILKDISDQKSTSIQKSRSRRKRSMERKRLSADAMAYFDERVSLSLNFDTSDLSASDDPSSLYNTPSSAPIAATTSSLASTSILLPRDVGHVQWRGRVREQGPGLRDERFDIREYLHKDGENFERHITKFPEKQYDRILQLQESPSQEDLLVDKVLLRRRLDSGGLLLCP